MLYFVVFQFLILLILILIFNHKQNIKLLNLSGIPMFFKFPYEHLNLIEDTNYIICLSTLCPHCRKIIEDIQNLDFATSNVYLIFTENKSVVDEYLEQYQSLNFEYLADASAENLNLKITPFVYTVNTNNIIIDKKVIKKINELEII